MFHKTELEKINKYLNLLACGVKDNGLTKEQEREVLNLACKCVDTIDEINKKYGLVTLTPFMYKPHGNYEEYLVYSVNCSRPEKTTGFMQGYFKCTHCNEGSQFRFYDDTYWPKYYTKCPKCNKEFVVEDDHEYEYE